MMLDEIAFADPRVREALGRFDVRRVDASKPTPATDSEAGRYDVRSPPTLVFVDSIGRTLADPRVTSFVPPDEMLAILARVR